MILELKFSKFFYPNGRWIWKSLVECEHQFHIGDRKRIVSKHAITKGVGVVFCKKCNNSELGKKNLGKKRSFKSCEKLRISHLNKKRSSESILKGLITRRGYKHSQQTKLKISLSRIGDKNPNWNQNRNHVLNRIKIHSACRRAIKRVSSKKNGKTFDLLGYSNKDFCKHIESTWEPWMNWNNYGKCYKNNETRRWSIDHKKPVIAFLKEGVRDLKIINALNNLRAIDANLNSSKGGKY